MTPFQHLECTNKFMPKYKGKDQGKQDTITQKLDHAVHQFITYNMR